MEGVAGISAPPRIFGRPGGAARAWAPLRRSSWACPSGVLPLWAPHRPPLRRRTLSRRLFPASPPFRCIGGLPPPICHCGHVAGFAVAESEAAKRRGKPGPKAGGLPPSPLRVWDGGRNLGGTWWKLWWKPRNALSRKGLAILPSTMFHQGVLMVEIMVEGKGYYCLGYPINDCRRLSSTNDPVATIMRPW